MDLDNSITSLHENTLDYTIWTELLHAAEISTDIQLIRSIYTSFLSYFPLFFGYWKKFAKLDPDRALEIYQQSVKSVPHSVDAWIFYCDYCVAKRDENHTRLVFQEATKTVGSNFLSHLLWNKYLEWEFSKKKPQNITKIFLQILQQPIQQLRYFWESFTNHASSRPIEELTPDDEDFKKKLSEITDDLMKFQEVMKYHESTLVQTVKKMNEIIPFENNIKRPFFHIKPLDTKEIMNWNQYLNFVEDKYQESKNESNEEFVIRVYERCLIPCVLYPNFWKRYAFFFENNNKIDKARSIFSRATESVVQNRPSIFIAFAEFEERQKNFDRVNKIFEGSMKHFKDKAYEIYILKTLFEKRQLKKDEKQEEKILLIYEKAMQECTDNDNSIMVLSISMSQYLSYRATIANETLDFKNEKILINKGRNILNKAFKASPKYKKLWTAIINYEILHGEEQIYQNCQFLYQQIFMDPCPLTQKDQLSIIPLLIDLCLNHSSDIKIVNKLEKLLYRNTLYHVKLGYDQSFELYEGEPTIVNKQTIINIQQK
ncbi:pre-mRNA-processing factor 39 [Anaeramoeba flamelloides]|uniref:Pre-mRNA-processing factor 39 n=1 Tax=Anaeramoeba flamelloides TaxID=1746091 RepID=A0ABQ8Z9H4_9EUKA|nr:pre-mRNA-processing factor 39 [Anaeramoeba flamelloides]